MNQSLAAMTDAIPVLLLAIDAAGKIVLWNRRLEEVTGYSRDEMLGQPGTALVGGHGACPLRVKQGRPRLVRWEWAARPSGNGEPWTFAIGTDLTEDHDLLASRRRADRLEAVGTLASGLAHEIRNPLNSALLQLAVLERRLERVDASPESLRPMAAAVEHELRRLDRLVDDFIAFVHPRPLNLRPTDLVSLCQSIAATLAPEVEAAGVQLKLELANGVPSLDADPERLQHVLLNLARNALEAMPSGGDLTLRVRRGVGKVEIDVADTGSGFPENAPVFDAFFTTKENGTGLGLSIVHRIVADHGGTVNVQSRPGNTIFTVALPDARAA